MQPDQEPDESRYGLSRLLRDTLGLGKGSTSEILQRLLKASRLYMGMEIAFMAEFSGGQRIFRYVDQANDADLLKVGDSDPLDDTYCQRVVDGRLPELIHDARELEEANKLPLTEELSIVGYLSAPIRLHDGSVFGTICTFSFRACHQLNERDLALMHVLAGIAAELVEEDLARRREADADRRRIQKVLDDDALKVVWQPIVEVGTGRIVGCESLIRFPEGVYDSPTEWFNVADLANLAPVLEAKAISCGLSLLEYLPPDIYVAINVSGSAVVSDEVRDLLRAQPLERIVLEITEHAVIEDYAAVTRALAPLRERGLRLAVDDAGAGYASFRHILALKPDLIKLDVSLTRDIHWDVARRSLAYSLVQFSKEIGCTLIAEGVETEAELKALSLLRIPLVQGFHLCRPQPLDTVLEFIAENRR